MAEEGESGGFVYCASVCHNAGANHGDRDRVGLDLSYTHVALREEESRDLSVPLKTVGESPEELQKLIGQELGDYVLGFIGHGMQSPMTLLRRAI